MMNTRLRRALPGRRILLVPAVLVALIAAATATHAYFTATGSGTGSSAAGTLQPVTVVAFVGGDAESSSLYPGGSAADVMVRLNNPNASSVTLVSVTGNGTITPDGSHSSCTTTGVTFTDQTGLSISLAHGPTLLHFASAASMDSTSSNGCQGATFQIPVTVTVHKP
jgi:hypothetical protein